MLKEKYDLIILDPGHGGNDPGCVYKGLKEKDLTLRIAHTINLFADNEYWILRNQDYYLSLGQRVFAVNKLTELRKPFLISLHINDDGEKAEGAEIFYCKLNPHYEKVIPLAETLLEIYTKRLRLINRGVKECKEARNFHFGILKEVKCPAMLFELGFIKTDFYLKKTNLKEKIGDIALIIKGFINVYLT